MKISIKNIRAATSLGVHQWEKESLRGVVINLDLHYDATHATRDDSIICALDYTALERETLLIAKKKHYNLLESLVVALGDGILHVFAEATEVWVEVCKPGALAQAEWVSASASFTR